MAVDWDFISQKGIEGESEYLTGYVPTDSSGFTVGSFDIGQHSKEDVRRILQSYSNKLAGGGENIGAIRQDLLDKVSPFAEDSESVVKYGSKDARDFAAKQVSFKKEDIDYLTAAKRYEFEGKLEDMEGWSDLDERTQTVLASIGWQWGTGVQDDKRNRFEELWAERGDKTKMEKKLRAMGGEGYHYRRNKEADYVNPPPATIQEVLNIDKNKELFAE
jgi:hypothetical protein